MNREPPSPEDRDPEADRIPLREDLAEVERKLKTARPRAAELDLARIEQLASEPARPLRAAGRPTGARRRFRTTALVAASWICGVVVGALLMFLAVSSGQPQSEPRPAVADGQRPVAERTPDGRPGGTSADGLPVADARQGRKPADRIGEPSLVDASDLFEQLHPPLWAGMHLAGAGEPTPVESPVPGNGGATVGDERLAEASPPRPDPDSRSTRQELLDDLLRETAGLTL